MKTTVTILKNRGSIYNIIGTIYKIEAPFKKKNVGRNVSTIYENASTIYGKTEGLNFGGNGTSYRLRITFSLDPSLLH